MHAITRRATTFALSASLVSLSALPAAANVEPTWEATPPADSVHLGNDFVEFVLTGDTPYTANPEFVYLAGIASQTGNAGALPTRTDPDVLFQALNAETGEQAWEYRYDCGTPYPGYNNTVRTAITTAFDPVSATENDCLEPGTSDRLFGFTSDSNNSYLYAGINVDGTARIQQIAANSGEPTIHTDSRGPFSIPRATGLDLAWGNGGSLLLAGERDGKFFVASYYGTRDLNFELDLIAGQATAVAPAHELDNGRRLAVTGTTGGYTTARIHTAVLDERGVGSAATRWQRSWPAPGATQPTTSTHRGIDVTQGNVGDTAVTFVLGETYTNSQSKDFVVLAYDQLTGALLWDDIWSGHSDDVPHSLAFDGETQTLYAVGTTAGADNRDEVVVLAYEPATGSLRNIATIDGGPDRKMSVLSLAASPEDERVFVHGLSADAPSAGNVREHVWAFDADLRPAGSTDDEAVTGHAATPGTRPTSTIAFAEIGDVVDVVVGTRTLGELTGSDQAARRFDRTAFALPDIESILSFTDSTTSSVEQGQDIVIEVALANDLGQPLAEAPVSVDFGGTVIGLTTDAGGLASTTIPTSDDTLPGDVFVTATYAGDGDRVLGSSDDAIVSVTERPRNPLAGRVEVQLFDDLNANGKRNGEDPLLTVPITVHLVANMDYGNPVETVTAANGLALFDEVEPGSQYQVVIDPAALPYGHVFTQANAGSDENLDSDLDSHGRSTSFTVGEEETVRNVDIGFLTPGTVEVGLFDDRNADGKRNGQDHGVDATSAEFASFDIVLTDANDHTPISEVEVDRQDGRLVLTNVPAGRTLRIRMADGAELPTGWAVTALGAGPNEKNDNDLDIAERRSVPFTTAGRGKAITHIDFGFLTPTTVEIELFDDGNADGKRTGEDHGIDATSAEFATFDIVVTDADRTDVIQQVQIERRDGSFLITNVPANRNLRIRMADGAELPTGWAVTALGAGSSEGNDNDLDIAERRSTSFQTTGADNVITHIDFGFILPATS